MPIEMCDCCEECSHSEVHFGTGLHSQDCWEGLENFVYSGLEFQPGMIEYDGQTATTS